MTLHKSIFWTHLTAGLTAGLVIGMMSLAGEEAPASRGPGMLATAEMQVAAPPHAATLVRDRILAKLQERFPEWTSMGLETRLAAGGALNVVVFEPAIFATRGRIQLAVDPYSGEVLTKTAFEDRSPGTRARVWIRFLHTGEAFGLPGRIIATVASAASLFLIYTGFMLSWRRFFGRKRATV